MKWVRRAARSTTAALVGTGAILSVGASVGWAQSAGAGRDVGDVVVVSPTNAQRLVSEGGSATVFALRLPPDAACPGDSAHDQWRVQTFVVPADVDPGQLRYETIKPAGEGNWALYDVDTNPVTHFLTAPNAKAGSPGRIVDLPRLSFGVFPPGTLAPGTYRIGVACTYYRETAQYWDTAIELGVDRADQPGQLRWSSVGAPASDDSAGRPAWIVGPSAAITACIVGLVYFVGRRRTSTPFTKEIA